MNRARAAWMVLFALCASQAWAGTPNGATIAQQGNGHGVAPCMACHGGDGGGQGAAGFPRLAGLPQAYLRKQLDDFANGTRVNATMQPVASGLSDAERDALAEYYSKLPIPMSAPSPAPAGDAAQAGQKLATRGNWTASLPGCEQCHGPGGIGVGDHFPPLRGQSAVYLSNQLHAWQQGSRRNDPLQLMQSVAAKLSEADIAAVSAWYAAQPAMPPKEPQP
ncbi:MAG TPA: c-type cytochrome [Dyella sp.]|uniref:c-type cytochrome n=1 Tax=Dyella sp. TaxID=1869338 RepID=UPI002C3F0672|nr:c-type cytochrome [Dyella sp.]HTV86268.1 c-type cytochrome [Dyella sp.]